MKHYRIIFLLIIPVLSFAQLWRVHDLNRPQPRIVTPGNQEYTLKAPSDAVILFDGTDLANWEDMEGHKTKWILKDGYFECVKGSGYIRTKQKFGDVQLHIEWATPFPPKGDGQGRGNSGVFLMGKYEVQVLDSYNNKTYPDGQAGAVYGQYPPEVNASLPPGKWQSYDIIFKRPRFNNLGYLQTPARMTVFHNGVLVQDNVKLWGETDWLKHIPYRDHPDRLPLSLQDHGNPVRYRNIWIRDLENITEKSPVAKPVITLSEENMSNYTGTYISENNDKYKIYIQNHTLMLNAHDRDFELVAYSKEQISAKPTAIDLLFKFDENHKAQEMIYKFEGKETETKRIE